MANELLPANAPAIEIAFETLRRVVIRLPPGISCEINRAVRRIGKDGFNTFVAASLREPESILGAAVCLARHAEDGKILFCPTEMPRIHEQTGTVEDPERHILGTFVRAWDVMGNCFIDRVDFLFKVVPVEAAAPPPADPQLSA